MSWWWTAEIWRVVGRSLPLDETRGLLTPEWKNWYNSIRYLNGHSKNDYRQSNRPESIAGTRSMQRPNMDVPDYCTNRYIVCNVVVCTWILLFSRRLDNIGRWPSKLIQVIWFLLDFLNQSQPKVNNITLLVSIKGKPLAITSTGRPYLIELEFLFENKK